MRLRILWWVLGLLMLAFVLVLCLVPLNLPPSAPVYNDKVLHVFTFTVLAVWFGALQAATVNKRLLLAALLLFFGVMIEILQSFTAYRSAEFADFVADFGGVFLGLILLQLGLSRWPIFVETYIFRLSPR
jgi:VanZ family protein